MPLSGFAISPRNIHAKVNSPLADANLVRMLAAPPSEDVLPPLFFGELASRAGLERSDGVGGFSARAQVVRRRECQPCLDPVAA